MLQLRELTYSSMLIRLLMAVVIGGILGLERGRKNRPAGLRTYMLVCLASAIVMMTNQYVTQCMGTGDPVRMGAQVISGIGFLGAGSIVVTQRNQIRGITTAAGLWASAAVGLAVGIGFYEVAIAGGLAVFSALTVVEKSLRTLKGLLNSEGVIECRLLCDLFETRVYYWQIYRWRTIHQAMLEVLR